MCYSTIELSLETIKVLDEFEEEAHYNILLIHRDKSGYTVALYEPHGADYDEKEREMTDLFLEYLERFFRDSDIPVVMIPRYHVSCPKGLQTYAEDDVGWCVMFSLFWYYCFLVVTRDLGLELSDGEMFRNLIGNLEIIIETVFYQEELMPAIYSFASKFTETALMLRGTVDYEQYRKDRKIMKRLLDEEDDMILLEDKHVSKRIIQRRTLEDETSPRKYNNDGEECKENVDCGSGNCCDNICTAISYYETPCDKNCECASGVCDISLGVSGSRGPRGRCSVIKPEERDRKKLKTMFSKMTLKSSLPDIKKR